MTRQSHSQARAPEKAEQGCGQTPHTSVHGNITATTERWKPASTHRLTGSQATSPHNGAAPSLKGGGADNRYGTTAPGPPRPHTQGCIATERTRRGPAAGARGWGGMGSDCAGGLESPFAPR